MIGYESAVIGQQSEDAIWDWERQLSRGELRPYQVDGKSETEHYAKLEDEAAYYAVLMGYLADEEGLDKSHDLRAEVVKLAEKRFRVLAYEVF